MIRILLDEDVPAQLIEILRKILPAHHVDHIHDIGWSGKKDSQVYADAAGAGYDVILTNDAAQLDDPDECRLIKKHKMHRISYTQRQPGVRGLALAVAAIVAAMPDVIEVLENADGQRLAFIEGLDHTRKRYRVCDPARDPNRPRYWPR